MAYSLAQQANRAAHVYFQVAAVYDSIHTPELTDSYTEREDYLLDFHTFDIWSENPGDWDRDNPGEDQPKNPLTRERRAYFKEQGFEFKRDLTVLYRGVSCDTLVAQWETDED